MALSPATYRYSFQNFSLTESSSPLAGLVGFSCEPKIDGGDAVFASGRFGVGFTRGTFLADVKVTFLAEWYYPWIKKHPYFLDGIYNFIGVNEEGSNRDKIEVINCRLNAAPFSAEGTDAIKIEVSGIALRVKINDQDLVQGDSQGLGTDAGAV